MGELKNILIKNIKSKIDEDINDINNEIEKINDYIIKCNEVGLRTEITIKFVHQIQYNFSSDKVSDNLYMYPVSSVFSISKLLNKLMSYYKDEGFDVVTDYSDYFLIIKWDKILNKEDYHVEPEANKEIKIQEERIIQYSKPLFYEYRRYRIIYTSDKNNNYKISLILEADVEPEVYTCSATSYKNCIDTCDDIYNDPGKYLSNIHIMEILEKARKK